MMSLFPKSIRVPIGAIQSGADRIAELSEQVQDYFDQLGNVANGLSSDGSWKGDDVSAFVEANSSNQKKYDKMIRNISEMAKILKMYTTVMENTDKEWAAKIRAIG